MVLITAEHIGMLETFRCWLYSFFHDQLEVTTLCITDVGGRLPQCSIYLPLIFNEREFRFVIDTIARIRDDTAILAITHDAFTARVSANAIPCATLNSCMEEITKMLQHTGSGMQIYPVCAVSETPHRSFTQREKEILRLVATGHAIKEIAYALGISEHTVTSHKRNLYLKTGAHTMQQLALFGLLHLQETATTRIQLASQRADKE
jgi:DNA-binding CsgD family transcriptional regulator